MVFEGDTLIAVTGEQLTKINLAIAGERLYRAENAILQEQLDNADSVIIQLGQVVALQDSVVMGLRKKFMAAEELNADLNNALKVQRKKDLNTTIGVGVGGILAGIILRSLLVK